jgi:hypothetical protein
MKEFKDNSLTSLILLKTLLLVTDVLMFIIIVLHIFWGFPKTIKTPTETIQAPQVSKTITVPTIARMTFREEPINIPIVEEPTNIPIKESIPTDPREVINSYIQDICSKYPNVEPELIRSMVQQESRYNPKATNGSCQGLMQISTRWHKDRATRLGVTDFYDPYSNILLGVDYISELLTKYKDPRLALMLYSMKHKDALELYSNGKISTYATTVLARAEDYKKGE